MNVPCPSCPPCRDAATRHSHHEAALRVRAAGRLWHMERAANLEQLWQEMGEDDFHDERLPYWTEIWPSSIALCSWLARRRREISGRICLDLGCGLGLCALTGVWLGARVLAADYEPEALRFAKRNAHHNAAGQPLWTVMDWRHPAVKPGSIFRLWGGDIMYEERFVPPVTRFLGHALAPDGAAWIAEPGRSIYGTFLRSLRESGWRTESVHTEEVPPVCAQPVPVTVTVWEIRRGASAGQA